METITLTFNFDPDLLKEGGVDPTDSEGKAFLREFFLDALRRSRNDSPVTEACRQAFLSEG